MLLACAVSLVASAAFSVMFNAPKKSVIPGGVVGMIAWMLYIGLPAYFHASQVFSTFVAAFVAGAICQVFARIFCMPVIVFSVSGMIPLVPGGTAYDTMRHLAEGSYNQAVQLASETFLMAGAIAFGLVLSGTFIPFFLKRLRKAR
ncbi:threonine/serine exporter family protein [Alicyclobacillus dauci]|uniref:Threonine/serine exporter family protein n=1 Tax=Alicyclobacillus dauci TaxID=1475485 RepID=A0ABY6Z4B5_9BACL|nr:threonine/serine exporter family protein [Alicyclobacillus dauci]WAH37722.1 threonine/serine exporter family protein [Alicyclobacillus dauci]